MTTRTITALFDSRAEAERAVEALVSTTGLDRSSVRLDAAPTSAGSAAPEEKGFFASLGELFMPDEDRYSYSEGMRRGGVLVSAQVDEVRLDRAMDVFEQHGAVDLDQREAEWRQSGWTGYGGAAATGTAVPDGAPGNPPGTMLSRGVDQAAGTNISGAHPENEGTTLAGSTGASAGALQGEQAIPIVEERLRVGKRDVTHGRVRVRRDRKSVV